MHEIIQKITDQLSSHIGRPASYRKENNQDAYWIQDPVFSYIQLADRNHQKGYRVGYRYNPATDDLYLGTSHSPVQAKIFKNNLNLNILTSFFQKTAKFRSTNYIFFSDSTSKSDLQIESDNFDEFLKKKIDQLNKEKNIEKRIFFTKSNQGKLKRTGFKAPVAGNDFYVLVAEQLSKQKLEKVISESWHLFSLFYPHKPIDTRMASLNRSLQKVFKECEYQFIKIYQQKLNLFPVWVNWKRHILSHINLEALINLKMASGFVTHSPKPRMDGGQVPG